MDLSMTVPSKPLAIERRGVPNPGAPVRSHAPVRAGWQALFDDRSKFLALIEKSKENNKNLMTRPSVRRKQHTAVDESHGTHMVPVLVRTTI